MKLIRHIRRWDIWRKGCLNSKFHKFLVLIGLICSPTMNYIFLPEECMYMGDIKKYINQDEQVTYRVFKDMEDNKK